MLNTSRVNDIWVGICCCHEDPTCISMSGCIIEGSWDIESTSSRQSRLFDTTIGSCGHTGIIISGAPTVLGNNLEKAILTSDVTGCNIGIVISGSPTHFTT